MSEIAEQDILCVDPFAGDFDGGGSDDGIMADKMVTCRKPRPCHTCAEHTTPGTRIRVRTEVYDGDFMRFAWCHTCCEIMGRLGADIDADDQYEARVEMGSKSRGGGV